MTATTVVTPTTTTKAEDKDDSNIPLRPRSRPKSLSNNHPKHQQKLEFSFQRTYLGNGHNPYLPPLPSHLEISHDPHKYGVLPFGNIVLDPKGDSVRVGGLGNCGVLNDEQLLNILSYLPADSLGRVVQCSGCLYVFGMFDDLWRDLTLKRNMKNLIDWTGQCWRDTLVASICPTTYIPHVELPIRGIYSDYLFRSWLCRSFDFSSLLKGLKSNISRLDSRESNTNEKFQKEFESKNIPCILTNVPVPTITVPDLIKRVDKDKSDGTTFRATSGAAPEPGQFTLESYKRYCDTVTEEAPLYLFDRTFDKKVDGVTQEVLNGIKMTCPFWDEAINDDFDLFRLLGKDRRPDFRWMIVGPERSGSSFHIDPNSTNAWNAPLSGTKYWIFYPPTHTPPGIHPSPDLDEVKMPISIGEWILTYWDKHLLNRHKGICIETLCHPGEIIFVPNGWWHCVINLDCSVAMTMNFVSKGNLKSVLTFLKEKVGQISGCRDRDGTVRPQELYKEFLDVVKKERPGLVSICDEILGAKKRICDGVDDDYCGAQKKVRSAVGSVIQRAKTLCHEEEKNCDANGGGFSFSFL